MSPDSFCKKEKRFGSLNKPGAPLLPKSIPGISCLDIVIDIGTTINQSVSKCQVSISAADMTTAILDVRDRTRSA
jgi:hypothetical protein